LRLGAGGSERPRLERVTKVCLQRPTSVVGVHEIRRLSSEFLRDGSEELDGLDDV
jgi:hypothetical protein